MKEFLLGVIVGIAGTVGGFILYCEYEARQLDGKSYGDIHNFGRVN